MKCLHRNLNLQKRLLRDGDLYKELNKYQCKTMEDILSCAWAHVKWEDDVATRSKFPLKKNQKRQEEPR